MSKTWGAKDPDERIDYSWTPPLDPGDTLLTGLFAIVDGDAIIDTQALEAPIVRAFISGGTNGSTTQFNAIATTAQGRIWEETIYLPIVSSAGPESFASFIEAFPAFRGIPSNVYNFWLAQATFLVPPACCPADRPNFLFLAMAHLLTLAGYPLAPGATAPSPAVVGRTSSATEGTVSVSFAYGPVSQNAAWWLQTQYGAMFWQMTARFRTARYMAAPPRYFGPAYGRPGRL